MQDDGTLCWTRVPLLVQLLSGGVVRRLPLCTVHILSCDNGPEVRDICEEGAPSAIPRLKHALGIEASDALQEGAVKHGVVSHLSNLSRTTYILRVAR